MSRGIRCGRQSMGVNRVCLDMWKIHGDKVEVKPGWLKSAN